MTPTSIKRKKVSGGGKDTSSSYQVVPLSEAGSPVPHQHLSTKDDSTPRKKRKHVHREHKSASFSSGSLLDQDGSPGSRERTHRHDTPQASIQAENQAHDTELFKYPTSSFELVRMLQDPKVLRSRKIEVAFEFIRELGRAPDEDSHVEADVSIMQRINTNIMAEPVFVSFLCEWAQSAILWSSKPQNVLDWKASKNLLPPHLDARYWAILRWCLSCGSRRENFVTVSPSLMKSLNIYVNDLLEKIVSSNSDLDCAGKIGISESLTDNSVRAVEILLLANERSFRPDPDHWMSLTSTALSKLITLTKPAPRACKTKARAFRLILSICEGFARFVDLHPNRKKIFVSLINRMLELLFVAHANLCAPGSQLFPSVAPTSENHTWKQRLLESIGAILLKGIFHVTHIGAFHEVCTVLAKEAEEVSKGDDMYLSYHILIFQRLNSLRQERRAAAAVTELGWMYQMYCKGLKSYQTADDVRLISNHGKVKPRSLVVSTNEGDEAGVQGKGNQDQNHNFQFTEKKRQRSEILFIVFAEFIWPLVVDLTNFEVKLRSGKAHEDADLFSSAKVSLLAVANILGAAQVENAYIATEDGARQSHLIFLGKCFTTLIAVGKSLTRYLVLPTSKVQAGDKHTEAERLQYIDEPRFRVLSAEMLRELIAAITYLMKMEYRVVEDSLRDIWIILFAELILVPSRCDERSSVAGGSIAVNESVVELACQMINIFSDLRRIDRAILSFCMTLRGLMIDGLESYLSGQSTAKCSPHGDVSLEAIGLLVTSNSFRLAVSSAVRALPEGQVAEFLRLLMDDALESSKVVNETDFSKHPLSSGRQHSEDLLVIECLKGFAELYSCILESIVVTSSNSVAVGNGVRLFLEEIVTPKLGQLIDIFSASKFSDASTSDKHKESHGLIGDPRDDSRIYSRKAPEDDVRSLLRTWVVVFLLRMYLITRSLHAESVSLMPPKAAKKARAAFAGQYVDYHSDDKMAILQQVCEGRFFSGVGRGKVKVSRILATILKNFRSHGLVLCPVLCYTLDCVALRGLTELAGHTEALSFLLAQYELATSTAHFAKTSSQHSEPVRGLNGNKVSENMVTNNINQSIQEKISKALDGLTKENRKVAKYLLNGAGQQEQLGDHEVNISDSQRPLESRLLVQDGQRQSPIQMCESEKAVKTGDINVRRWDLLCKSFDIWSKYAAEADLKKFLIFLFSTSLTGRSTLRTEKATLSGHEEPAGQHIVLREITDATLGNVLFYEEESFRRLLSSTIVEELQKSLSLAFKMWPFTWSASESCKTEEFPTCVAQEWSDFTARIKVDIKPIGSESSSPEKVETQNREGTTAHRWGPRYRSSASDVRGSESQTNQTSIRPTKNQGCRWTKSQMRALERSVGLVDRLAALPPGYIEANDRANCAYTTLCFERLLMDNLLEMRATALSTYHGSEGADFADFSPTLHKLLEALCACRAGLLATSRTDNLSSSSSLMILLAGSVLSMEWFSLSVRATAACLADVISCSKLDLQQRKDLMASWSILLDNVVKSTAALVTFLSENTLIDKTRKSTHQAHNIALVSELDAQDIIDPLSVRNWGAGGVLSQVMAEEVEILNKLTGSKGAIESNGRLGVDSTAEFLGYDSEFKVYYEELTLSASLSSYFWVLSRAFADSVKDDPAIPNTSSALLNASIIIAPTLGRVLTQILLRFLVPGNSSHAMTLFGEVNVDKELASSKEERATLYGNEVYSIDSPQTTVAVDAKKEEIEGNDTWPKPTMAFEEETSEIDEDDDDTKETADGISGMDTALERVMSQQEEEDGCSEFRTSDSEFCYTELSSPQRRLLENILKGHCSKGSVIGELFLATAGILKLECTKLSSKGSAAGSKCPPQESGCHAGPDLHVSSNMLIGAGYWLLHRAAEIAQPDQWTNLDWLVGPVKYMETVFSLFPSMKPPLPPLPFRKLFATHIELLGALISAEDSLRHDGLDVSSQLDGEYQQAINYSYGAFSGGETICRKRASSSAAHSLRVVVHDSLKVLLRTAPRYHSILALQLIMRALVGASDDCSHRSGLQVWGTKTGEVGRRVAAAVECLLLGLGAISGTKRLRLLANHFNEFFGAIFSLLDYLHGPDLFQNQEPQKSSGKTLKIYSDGRSERRMVDSGPVVFQALQILITAASREAIFPMKSSHISLALHCPAILFGHFGKFEFLKPKLIGSFIRREQQHAEQAPGLVGISSELGVKLYVSCCRLLCSVIRHRRRESGHCVSLLGDSARVLLKCLESCNWVSSAESGTGNRSTQMAAYCASWLRRIYEEMGEHNESLGKYSSHLLSDFLSVLSGHGPNASGLSRDVEAALRPGIFALIDACSPSDLQQLHAALGEGPRRTALVQLKRQYQEQFKYTGKV